MKTTLISLLFLLLCCSLAAQDTLRFSRLEAYGRKILFELKAPEKADVYFVSLSSRWSDDYHCLIGYQGELARDTFCIPSYVPIQSANYLVVIQTRPGFNVHYGTVAIKEENP